MKKAIYLITGVMAAGKSTVAEILARRLEKGVHLRGDIFRRMIVSGRAEMSAEPSPEAIRQLQLRYLLAANAARTYCEHGFSVVMQDNYYGAELTRMTEWLSDYPLRVVVLCPSVEAVRERERSRGKVGYTGFAVKTLYESFMAETPRIGFWLDTSGLSPEQSADAILARFEEGK